MSRILRPWTSQPQSPAQVNSDLGLVGLVLPGQSRFDLVTGQELAAVGGTPTQVVGPYGQALLTDANQEYISAPATPAQRLTAEGSIVWVGELFAGFSSDSSLGGISHNSSNNPPYVTLELKRRGLFVYLSYSFNGGASFGETQLNVGSYTGPAIIVGTYRAGEQRAFMRTPTEVFAAGTIAAGSMGSSATSLWSVGERLNARNPQASCALLGVADRCWSEAQALAVLGSPWAEAFRPRTLSVPAAAGGGPDVTQALSGVSAAWQAGTPAPTVTAALSGTAASFAAGTVAPSQAVVQALTGVSAAAQTGTLSASITAALSGASATWQAGSVTSGSDVVAALSGVSATFAQGTEAVSIAVALSGTASTFAAGTVAPAQAGTAQLTGVSTAVQAGALAPTITRALSGLGSTFAAGTVAPTQAAVQALTGQAATYATGTLAPTITVALSGQAVNSARGTVSPTQANVQALSGVSATLATGTLTPTSSATVALSGLGVAVSLGVVGLPQSATVALVGQSLSAVLGNLYIIGAWTPVNDAAGNTWAPVNDTSSNGWTPITWG